MQMKRPKLKGIEANQGFSMPEVMISSALLALVVSNSTHLFMKSGVATSQGSSRDSVAAAVAKDLEGLRTKAFQYHCHSGPCSTDPSEIAKPISYVDVTDSNAVDAMETLCTNKSLEDDMVANDSALTTSGSINIALDSTNVALSGITIQRTLATSSDSHQLLVSYQATAGSPIKFSLNSNLSPTAEGWCP